MLTYTLFIAIILVLTFVIFSQHSTIKRQGLVVDAVLSDYETLQTEYYSALESAKQWALYAESLQYGALPEVQLSIAEIRDSVPVESTLTTRSMFDIPSGFTPKFDQDGAIILETIPVVETVESVKVESNGSKANKTNGNKAKESTIDAIPSAKEFNKLPAAVKLVAMHTGEKLDRKLTHSEIAIISNLINKWPSTMTLEAKVKATIKRLSK